MRKLIPSLLLLISFSLHATSLPPEHESARLMLSLESLIEQQNWVNAQQQLQALTELEISPPTEFYYFYGLVYLHLNHFSKAQSSLERYVINAGHSGNHYDDALKLITQADEDIKHASRSEEEKSLTETIQPLAKRDGYIKSLEALYLTDSPIEALSLQINSLLSSNPYTGSRVKKAHTKEGVIYSLSVNKSNLMLQEKNYVHGLPTLSATTLDINGLDPFLKYDCSSQEFACWLYSPVNNHIRWIKIDHDEMVVSELAKAMTKLIQRLQKLI